MNTELPSGPRLARILSWRSSPSPAGTRAATQGRPYEGPAHRAHRWPALAGVTLLTLAGLIWFSPLSTSPAAASHATGVGVSIEPPVATVATGGSTTVAVQAIAPAATLAGWTVDIGYDAAVVSVTACTSTVSLCSALTTNPIRVSGTSIPGLAGTATLASIVFTAKSNAALGSSALTVTIVEFLDPNVAAIPNPLATGGTINVIGPPAKLVFTTQPGGGTPGAPLSPQPVAAVQDADGNTVVTDNTTVVTLGITPTTNTNGATLACTGGLTWTVTAGSATFAGCKIDRAGVYTLTATSSSLTSATSASLDVVVQLSLSPTSSSLVQGGTGNVGIGLDLGTQQADGVQVAVRFDPTILEVVDADPVTEGVQLTLGNCALPEILANTVFSGEGRIHFARGVGVDPPTSPISGNCTMGSISFRGKALGTSVLAFTLPPVFPWTKVVQNEVVLALATTGGSVTVVAPPAALAIVTQPGGVDATSAAGALDTQPVVEVRDASGNVVTTDPSPTDTETMAVAFKAGTNEEGAILSGTTTVPVDWSTGRAAFTNLSVDKVGSYQLTASTNLAGLGGADSAAFTVIPGPSTKLVFTTQPGGGTAGVPWISQPAVAIQDAQGNTVPTATNAVTLAITSGTGTAGTVLTCTANPVNPTGGVATFVGCKTDRGGTGYTLTATAAGLTNAVSSAFNVVSAPTVTGISPASRSVHAGATTVTITGTGFQAGATVASTTPATATVGATTFVSATSLTVPVTPVAAGTTTFTVTNPDGGTATSGAFTVTADDHGNTPAAATSVAAPSTTPGNIEVAGDWDYFSFPTSSGVEYRFSTTLGTLGDSVLTLFGTDGVTQLGNNDDCLHSCLTWTAPASGIYYLRVRSLGSTGTGTYTLQVLTDDHGNTPSAATQVAVPSTTAGNIEKGGDVDYFRFTAAAGSSYYFETFLGSLPDSLLTLYDTNGTTQLATDDDSGPGLGSFIAWIAPASGTYFLKVAALTSSQTGTYSLRLTVPPTCLAETAHPYVINTDQTFTITNPDTSAMTTRVHFFRLATEAQYDFVVIKDANNNVVQTFHGEAVNGRWSKPVPGRTVTIRFTSDDSVNDYGFCVDQVSSVVAAGGGTAQVFVPNPVQSSGDTTLRDNDNADSPALTAQRAAVTLNGLDGSGHLAGPYADVTGNGIFEPYKAGPLAYELEGVYGYTRADDRFEEALVYHHVDAAQRYLQSLGFTSANNRATAAHAHWDDFCNAFYSSFDGGLHFGDCDPGGVDLAEDGDVVVHEYGHAVLDNIVPDIATAEGAAIHEGFSDYLAISMFAEVNGGFQRECLGDWIDVPGCTRRVDGTKHYPEDLVGEPHRDGEIWSAALWQMRLALGRTVADTLTIESFYFMDRFSGFREGANALLQADQSLYAGAHRETIRSIFLARGILVSAGVSLVPSQGAAGSTARATVVGFDATEQVTLRWETATGTVLATLTTNSRGEGSAAFTVPANAPTGAHQVVAVGASSGRSAPARFLVGASKIAFASDRDGNFNFNIYVMNPDGSGQTRLTTDPAADVSPAWSPDGTRIAFTSNRDAAWQIYVMDGDGSGQTRLTNSIAGDSAPAWSPDGTKIAFMSFRHGNWEIYVMNPDGSGQTRLTDDPASDGGPAWSPDGSKIVFSANRNGNYDIYTMNADGSGQARLTDSPSNSDGDNEPVWSPDGSKMAFTSTRDGNSEIYVMNSNGSGQTRLTNNSSSDKEPAWSLDGSKIAFYSDRDGNREVYVMNPDGGAQTRLINNSADDRDPAWGLVPVAQAPVVSVAPTGLSLAVQRGTTATQTLTLSNTVAAGGESLTFSITDAPGVVPPPPPSSGGGGGPTPTPAATPSPLPTATPTPSSAKEGGTAPTPAAVPPAGSSYGSVLRPGERPFGAITAAAVANLQTIITDPAGDRVTRAGEAIVDVVRVDAGADRDNVTVRLFFSSDTVMSKAVGYVQLDTDQNPATGRAPSTQFGRAEQNIGFDFSVDLFLPSSGQVGVWDAADHLLGEVPRVVSGQSLEFTVPLSMLNQDDGRMDLVLNAGDIGVQDWAPDTGHGTILVDLPWLSEAPASGTVAPQGSQAVTVTVDATGLAPGTYYATLFVDHNGGLPDPVTVPVTVTVFEPTLTVTPGEGRGGTAVTTTGGSFVPGQAVTLTWDDPALTLGTPTVDQDGTFTASFTVHPVSALGGHTVTATQGTRVATATFTVTRNLPPPALSGPADGAQLATLGTTLTWQNPPDTAQVQLRVMPSEGPAIHLVLGSAATSYTIPEPGLAGPHTMLPDMTYIWQVRVSDAGMPIQPDDPSWSGPASRTFHTRTTSTDTITLVAPANGTATGPGNPTLRWTNSDSSIWFYEVELSRSPSFTGGGCCSSFWQVSGDSITPCCLGSDAVYYWRVRPWMGWYGTPLPWSKVSSFATGSPPAVAEGWSVPVDLSQTPGRSGWARVIGDRVGGRHAVWHEQAPVEFLTKWGSYGSGDGQLNRPWGVAVDSAGSVYVADSYNHRIQKFTGDGTLVAKWGSYGSGNGQFNYPQGIAVDAAGNVYVTDVWNHRIQKFSNDGTFLGKWGSNGSGDGQFRYPWGVSVDTTGNVYVADAENHRIQKFSSVGAFLGKWGSYGSGDGQFLWPWDVTVDAAGNVYVADRYNYRIQKFSSAGALMTMWGGYGGGSGQFYCPSGMAAGATGLIYVADPCAARIQAFSTDGDFITKWGGWGGRNGEFNSPEGVAVDSAGHVYVSDTYNHRIQKFSGASTWEVVYSGQASNGAWSAPVSLSHSPGDDSQVPRLAADAVGNLHVVWEEHLGGANWDIFYATRPSGGQWSAPVNLSNNFGTSGWPGIAVDGSGAVHVVWEDNTSGNSEIMYLTWQPCPPQPGVGCGGGAPGLVNVSNNTGRSLTPALALQGDALHLIWTDDTPGNFDIFYATKSGAGAWSAPENISSTSGLSGSPALAVDGLGQVHAVWNDGTPQSFEALYDVFYTTRASSGTWSAPVNLSNDAPSSTWPAIAADALGGVTVAWQEGTAPNDSYLRATTRSSTGGGWSTPSRLFNTTGTVEFITLSAGPDGRLHLAWKEGAPDREEIVYASKAPAPGTPAPGPTITLAPSQGRPGTPVTVTGAGFSASAQVTTLLFDGAAVANVSPALPVPVNGGGFSVSFPVPASAGPGNHTVTAAGDVAAESATAVFAVVATMAGAVLTGPADGAQLATLGTALTWQNPPGTTQVQLRVTPFNNEGPGIHLLLSSAVAGYTIAEPSMVVGPFIMLPDMTYTWEVRVSDAATPIADSDPSWSAPATSRFHTRKASSDTVTMVAPANGAVTDSTSVTLRWANSDPAIWYYEVQGSKDPGFGSTPCCSSEFNYFVQGDSTDVNAQYGAVTYWRVRPAVRGDGVPLPWSRASSFVAGSFPAGAEGWSVPVDLSQTPGRSRAAQVSGDGAGGRHAVWQEQAPVEFQGKWGSLGSGNGQFQYPRGVAVDGAGNVYVADSNNQRVQKFSTDGAFLITLGGQGQFGCPNDVTVDGSGFIYVVDPCWGSVHKLGADGAFVARWGSWGDGDGEFQQPQGLAVDGGGNVLVADSGNHRIQKFSSTGTFLGKWGGYGSGDGQFQWPWDVAVDAMGQVYVADRDNGRVQKFAGDGAFLGKWGSGQLNCPSGIAVDGAGRVYVSEECGNRVQAFGGDGRSLAQWGSYGSGNGQFNSPQRVAVDAAGRVYVADQYNHRVQKFSGVGAWEVLYATQPAGGAWSAPVNLSLTPNADSQAPRIASDGAGGLHVVWEERQAGANGDIFYAARPAGGQWSAPVNLSSNPGSSGHPGIAVDGTGAVHVVWEDDSSGSADVLYLTKPAGGGQWPAPVNVSDNAGRSLAPALALQGDTLHLIWADSTPGNFDIFYAGKSGSGAWSAPENVSNTGGLSGSPGLAVDRDGNVHAVWHEGMPLTLEPLFDVFYAARAGGGSWTTPQNLANDTASSTWPAIAVDTLGGLTVAWQDGPAGGAYLRLVSKAPAGGWSNPDRPFNTTGTVESIALSADPSGRVHLAWQEGTQGREEIIFASKAPAPGTPTLVPTITLVPVQGRPGMPVTLTGSGFTSSTQVTTVLFDGAPVPNASPALPVAVDGGGFSVSFAVPVSAGLGNHTVTATGNAPGESATATFTVTAVLPPPVLGGPADGARLTSLGAALAWQNPPGTTQVQLRVTPYNGQGPETHLIFGTAATSYTIPEPTLAGGPYVMLPDMTYTWYVQVSDAATPITATDPSWGPPAIRTFHTRKASSDTIALVAPAIGSVTEAARVVLQWENSDDVIWLYEVEVSKDPSFSRTRPEAPVGRLDALNGGKTSPPNSTTMQLDANTTYYWRVRPRVQGDGDPVAWSRVSSFATVAPPGGAEGWSVPVNVSQTPGRSGWARTIADGAGNRHTVWHELPAVEFLSKWGSPGGDDGQFREPQGVGVDAAGNVYVADSGNHRVQKFTGDGAFLSKWGTWGSGDGQLWGPQGIAVDPAGNVYVADTGNYRIQKFTLDGTFVAKWGSWGSGDGQFNYPMGIAVDTAGNVYVTDIWNHRVQMFSSAGVFLGKWGSYGTGDGQFLELRDVAVDGAGNSYVADGSGRIQKFGSGGAFLGKWATNGCPRGLAVDGTGRVYVSDGCGPRIQVFSQEGRLLTQWGSWGSAGGQFNSPDGLAVDGAGRVYVADRYNHRIQQFSGASAWEVLYASQPAGGAWSAPANLSLTPGNDSQVPKIAADAAGGLHVVWEERLGGANWDIFYVTRPAGGQWSAPVNLSNNPGTSGWPAIAVDGSGSVHVVWEDDSSGNSEILSVSKPAGGAWSAPVNVSTSAGRSLTPALALHGDTLHLIWTDNTPGNFDIFYAGKSGSGAWSAPVNLSGNSGLSGSPALAVDGQGNVHAVWNDGTPFTAEPLFSVFYATKPSGGAWSTPASLSSDTASATWPAIAVDTLGGLTVAWQEGVANGSYLQATTRAPGGTWSSPARLFGTSATVEFITLSADSSGRLHMAWKEGVDGREEVISAIKSSLSLSRAITLSPEAGPPGTVVTVTGSGFSTSAPVRVLFDGAEVPSGPPVACIALAGTFCRTFIVPAGAGLGNHPVTAAVGSSPGESATATFAVTVLLELTPGAASVAVGGTVDVAIRVSSGAQDLDAVEAVLSFNRAYLGVEDMDPSTAGVQIALGDCAFPTPLANQVDPTGGTIHIGRGVATSSPQLVDGSCTLGVIRFRGLANPGTGTPIPITFVLPPSFPATKASLTASSLPLTVRGNTVQVTDRALVFTSQPVKAAHSFSLGVPPVVAIQQGGATMTADGNTVVTLGIRAGTGTPGATLSCKDLNGNNQDENLAAPGMQQTVRNGVAAFHGCAIDLKGEGYVLEAVAEGASLAVTAPFNVLWAGDANGDCLVDILDFSVLAGGYGKQLGGGGYDPRADLTGDNQVDVLDFSVLVTLFGTRCTTLTVAPVFGAAGTEVTLTGTAYVANRAVTVTWDGVPTATAGGPVSANGSGAFSASFVVPAGATAGSHVVKASQANGRVAAAGVFRVP